MKTSHVVLTLAGVAGAFLIWKAWNKPSASKEGSTSSNTDPLAGRPNMSNQTNFDGLKDFVDFNGGDYTLRVKQAISSGRIKVSGGTGAGPKKCFDTVNGVYVPCPKGLN